MNKGIQITPQSIYEVCPEWDQHIKSYVKHASHLPSQYHMEIMLKEYGTSPVAIRDDADNQETYVHLAVLAYVRRDRKSGNIFILEL